VASQLEQWERILTTLREDDLHALTPGEPEHGHFGPGYPYDGYLWWQDEETPPQPWFSRHTEREADFNWDLNWTLMHLSSSGERRCRDGVYRSPEPVSQRVCWWGRSRPDNSE
jgi:hypothetical protein